MRAICAGMLAALLIATAVPAAAGIVEIATSVAVPDTPTDDIVRDAVRRAARDVLGEVAPLEPVVMVLTAAVMHSGRLYVRFLIADEDGARELGLEAAPGPEPDPTPLRKENFI